MLQTQAMSVFSLKDDDKIISICSFAADQQLDGEDVRAGQRVAVQEDGESEEQRARSSVTM